MPKLALTQKPKIPEKEAAICARMRAKRIELGVPQKELAKKMGVSWETLRSYEYARAPVRYGFADRFCDELDVNQRWLHSGDLPSRPYVGVSLVWAQFIPPDMHFSMVADSLLNELILEVLREIASIDSDPPATIAELDSWDNFPVVPQAGPTFTSTRDGILATMNKSLVWMINRSPPSEWIALAREVESLVSNFGKKRVRLISDYQKKGHDWLLTRDEQFARENVAARLKIDPSKLAKISLLQKPRRRLGAATRRAASGMG